MSSRAPMFLSWPSVELGRRLKSSAPRCLREVHDGSAEEAERIVALERGRPEQLQRVLRRAKGQLGDAQLWMKPQDLHGDDGRHRGDELAATDDRPDAVEA